MIDVDTWSSSDRVMLYDWSVLQQSRIMIGCIVLLLVICLCSTYIIYIIRVYMYKYMYICIIYKYICVSLPRVTWLGVWCCRLADSTSPSDVTCNCWQPARLGLRHTHYTSL